MMTTTQNNEEKEEEKKDHSNNVCNNCEPTKTHSLPEQLHPIHLQSRQEQKKTGCQWDQQCSWPQSWQQTTGEAMETKNDLLKHSSECLLGLWQDTAIKTKPPLIKKENWHLAGLLDIWEFLIFSPLFCRLSICWKRMACSLGSEKLSSKDNWQLNFDCVALLGHLATMEAFAILKQTLSNEYDTTKE